MGSWGKGVCGRQENRNRKLKKMGGRQEDRNGKFQFNTQLQLSVDISLRKYRIRCYGEIHLVNSL